MTETVPMVPLGSLAGVRVEDVLNTARQPLVVLDADIRVVAANPAFCKGFGLTAAEVAGARLYDLADGAWNAPSLRALLEDILPARSEFTEYELTHVFGPLGHRTLVLNAREIRERDGVDRLILLALEDVTLRRSAESILLNNNTELRRSNTDLQEFASIASHDLQEPLRKIQAFGDMLQRQLGDRLDDGSKDSLARIRGAAARMSTLLTDLLTYARVDQEKAAFGPVSLAAVARRAVADLDLRIAETGATVTLGELPTVFADRSQMAQLFENLLGNALKFRRPEVRPDIRIDAVALDDKAHAITISDNGIGFEPQYADRIFGMFRRLHGRTVEGSGIGLALCRRIVERHAGRIEAHGEAGVGARFVVTLPALARAPR